MEVKYCHRIKEKGIVLLLDSSDSKVFGEGEWKVRKQGTGYGRTWRKTHTAVEHGSRDIIGAASKTALV
jgi:hypothetical protein